MFGCDTGFAESIARSQSDYSARVGHTEIWRLIFHPYKAKLLNANSDPSFPRKMRIVPVCVLGRSGTQSRLPKPHPENANLNVVAGKDTIPVPYSWRRQSSAR